MPANSISSDVVVILLMGFDNAAVTITAWLLLCFPSGPEPHFFSLDVLTCQYTADCLSGFINPTFADPYPAFACLYLNRRTPVRFRFSVSD